MQCAVTGNAFEYLLHLPDLSLLDSVLRNAVVFSRMQVCNLPVFLFVILAKYALRAL